MAQYQLYSQWKLTYGVSYDSSAEDLYRYEVFKKNYEIITSTNNKNLSYTLALNKFADLTREEFKAMYCGFDPSLKTPGNVTVLNSENLPTSVNWTAQGATTPIKNQGTCGSCWAFSTTGSLEGLNFLTNNVLLSFSEQQLVDCSLKYGNLGCMGGEMDRAFKYVIKNGIMLESEYPYKGALEIKCEYNASEVAFNITGYTDVTPKNVTQLMAAAAQQPVSIAVQADQASWQFYDGGIISSDCGQALDHGVLIAGYGTSSNGTDFWWVKNSWGEDWGIYGYLMIWRSQNDTCGVLDMPSYPTL
jgi:cathepsin L